MGFELSEGLSLSLKKILFSENTLTRLPFIIELSVKALLL